MILDICRGMEQLSRIWVSPLLSPLWQNVWEIFSSSDVASSPCLQIWSWLVPVVSSLSVVPGIGSPPENTLLFSSPCKISSLLPYKKSFFDAFTPRSLAHAPKDKNGRHYHRRTMH
eukprot:scaffold785_cov158-Skeletonema_menzelii.AAC.2